MSIGFWLFLAICVIWCVGQILYTRWYEKRMEEQTRLYEEMYHRHRL